MFLEKLSSKFQLHNRTGKLDLASFYLFIYFFHRFARNHSLFKLLDFGSSTLNRVKTLTLLLCELPNSFESSTKSNQTMHTGNPPKFLPSFTEIKIFHPLKHTFDDLTGHACTTKKCSKHSCAFSFFSRISLNSDMLLTSEKNSINIAWLGRERK